MKIIITAVAMMSSSICLKMKLYGLIKIACTSNEPSSFIGIYCVLIISKCFMLPCLVVSIILPSLSLSIYK